MEGDTDASHTPRRQRGQYKQYLSPENLREVPRTTKWRRLNSHIHNNDNDDDRPYHRHGYLGRHTDIEPEAEVEGPDAPEATIDHGMDLFKLLFHLLFHSIFHLACQE